MENFISTLVNILACFHNVTSVVVIEPTFLFFIPFQLRLRATQGSLRIAVPILLLRFPFPSSLCVSNLLSYLAISLMPPPQLSYPSQDGSLLIKPDLTANFRPNGGDRIGWGRTLGCGRANPKHGTSLTRSLFTFIYNPTHELVAVLT